MNDKALKPVEQSHPIAEQSQADKLLEMAIEKGTDMAQLEKLMDLKERYDKEEARKAFVTAMTAFRSNCPAINRNRKGHNSRYSGLAETIEQIKPFLSECGLSHSWKTEQGEAVTTVTCCVMHVQGHQECTSLQAAPDTSGSKNSIQAIGSTISYLERYTLFAILGLASSEMDDDGNTANAEPVVLITGEQATTLHAKLTDNDLSMDIFMGWLTKAFAGVNSIDEIPATFYERVEKKIDQSIKAKASA